MLDTIKSYISQTHNQYYKLILLVGDSRSGTRILKALSDELDLPITNLGLELAVQLLEIPPKTRPLRVQHIVEEMVSKQGGDMALLDHLACLFEPSLQQNPLNLLKQLSRNHTIIASWRGGFSDGKITYAIQGHSEYRQYDARDILIFPTAPTTHV